MNNNIVRNFLKTVEKNEHFNILKYKKNNKWKNINRGDLLNKINNCIYVLNDQNVKKGDRVAYKGKNSVEWLSWNMAALSLGATWVPMYEQQTQQQCQYIVNNCQPKVLITNEKINIINTNTIDNKINDLKFYDFNSIDVKSNNLSTLIYTSGTTGNPKGVMLSHENILSNIEAIRMRFKDIQPKLTSLNILPWAHIYGLTCELYYNLFFDNKTALCSDKLKFIDECKEIKPEVLYVVPKVLETVKSKTQFLDKPLVRTALPFVVNKVFGGNLLNMFIGGAKLDKNTREYFEKSNVLLCEGYGCSETSPMVSVNHLYNPKNPESIGKIMDNIDVKIINGEICVSGPNVMKGYWMDDEETNNVFLLHENKVWYKTGDSGVIKDGFLFFNGRISENYKMNNGKFVNVASVEAKLKRYINTNFIIYGENMDYSVLIVEEPFDEQLLDTVNSELESYMKIKKVIKITTDEMTNFLTPKMSIKRKKLIEFVKNSNTV